MVHSLHRLPTRLLSWLQEKVQFEPILFSSEQFMMTSEGGVKSGHLSRTQSGVWPDQAPLGRHCRM